MINDPYDFERFPVPVYPPFPDADVDLTKEQIDRAIAVLREWDETDEWDERKLIRRIYAALTTRPA